MYIQYERRLTSKARELRKNQTKAEKIFWSMLRGRKFLGLKFLRQKPLLNYIVDFYCSELRLAIEIDGSSHAGEKVEYDINRTKQLNSIGIFIKRYTNDEIIYKLEQVKENLAEYIKVYRIIRNRNPKSPYQGT